MRPSAEVIAVIIRRDQMPVTGAYDTVKSTTSSLDYTSANIFDYRSYWLSMSVVFTLKYILGLSIFLYGGSK